MMQQVDKDRLKDERTAYKRQRSVSQMQQYPPEHQYPYGLPPPPPPLTYVADPTTQSQISQISQGTMMGGRNEQQHQRQLQQQIQQQQQQRPS
jgi:hypothetical protein